MAGRRRSKIDNACREWVRQDRLNSAKSTDDKRTGFEMDIHNDFTICENPYRLKVVSWGWGISPHSAVHLCTTLRRQVIDSRFSNDYNALEEEIMGGIDVDRILESSAGIKPQSLYEGIDYEVFQAYKPGIDQNAPSAVELLVLDGEPWYCISNEPFIAGSDFRNSANEGGVLFPVFSYSDIEGLTEDHGFRYSFRNGFEVAGSNNTDGRFRSIRVEYHCGAKKDITDCEPDDESANSVLLIEESIKGRGIIPKLVSWGLTSIGQGDVEDAVYSYLAARSRRSMSDYLDESDKDCGFKQLLTGCEMAINYLVCSSDIEVAVNVLGMSLYQLTEFVGVKMGVNLLQLQSQSGQFPLFQRPVMQGPMGLEPAESGEPMDLLQQYREYQQFQQFQLLRESMSQPAESREPMDPLQEYLEYQRFQQFLQLQNSVLQPAESEQP